MTTIAQLIEVGSTAPPRPLSIGEIGAWWHGGPPIAGDLILPPVATGAEPIDAAIDQPQHRLDEWLAVGGRDHRKVYVTSHPPSASTFAVLWPEPWLYLVKPSSDLESDPDGSALPADHWIKFARCSTASIVARCRLDPQVVDTLRRRVFDHPLTRRAPGSSRWSPSTDDWNRLRPPTFGDLIDGCA
jgi:hypothetical protein